MSRTRRLAVFASLTWMLACQHGQIDFRSGDLIFQDLDGCALCDGIESVTKQQFGVAGPDLSHVAIVSVEGSRVFVYEAWDQVRRRSLEEFLAKADYDVSYQAVRRPLGIDDAIWARIKGALDHAVGLPYDEAFLVENGALYCSELVVEAFNSGFEGEYFSYVPMYYGEPESSVFLAWKAYFDGKGLRLPAGEPGASPLGLFLSERLKPVPD